MSREEREEALHPILVFLQAELPLRLSRSLVLAPSAGAAAALRRQLTRRRGALLGIDFVTAAGLGQRLLLLAGRHASDRVPDPLEERELLRELLSEDEVGRYARRFGSALEHLRESLRELDAQGPTQLPHGGDGKPESLSATGQQVVRIGTRYRAALRHRGGRARWIAAATDAVLAAAGTDAPWLPDQVLVAGPRPPERDTQLLLEILRGQGVHVAFSPAAAFAHRSPIPLSSSPHAFAELRHAARRCADAAVDGTPWHEMVVAAPHVQTYADHLHRAFAAEGVPVHTAVESPLINHPRASLCLHVAQLLFGDAPRPSFLALAGSDLLTDPVTPDELGKLERLSRRHSLSGTGPESKAFASTLHWSCTRDREAPAPAVVRLLRRVLTTAEAARAADPDGRQGFQRRSALLRSFLREHLRPPLDDDAAGLATAERIDDCLDAVIFAGSAHGSEDLGTAFTSELSELLRSRTAPAGTSTVGGVHAVSFPEALAIPCRILQLIGLTEQAVPQAPPLTTFLSEADREALRMQTGDRARAAEEAQLQQLLGHAPQVHLSFPRTDVRGRAVGITCWVERLARHAPIGEEAREPAHPESVARRAAESGRCPTDLAVDHLALSGCEDTTPFLRLLHRPRIRPVLQRIRELEDFRRPTLDLDGDIGPRRGRAQLDSSLPVTSLTSLSNCPQRFLFEYGFRIRPLLDEPDPLSLPRDRIGTLIHQVVENLYTEFLPALRAAGDPTDLTAAMHDRAAILLEAELARDTSTLKRRFPGLHALLQQRWLDGLRVMLDADLALMARDGSRPERIEAEIRCSLPFRGPGDRTEIEFQLNGKLDRIDTLGGKAPEDQRRILDFKTGTKPDKPVTVANILKGTHLQLAVYARMLQESNDLLPAEIEVRSIRPRGGEEELPDPRIPLKDASSFLVGELATGVDETMAFLGRLIDRGLLPPVHGRHCSYCRFKPACRRFHPPSAQRVEECDEDALRDFRRLSQKSSKKPILDSEDDA